MTADLKQEYPDSNKHFIDGVITAIKAGHGLRRHVSAACGCDSGSDVKCSNGKASIVVVVVRITVVMLSLEIVGPLNTVKTTGNRSPFRYRGVKKGKSLFF